MQYFIALLLSFVFMNCDDNYKNHSKNQNSRTKLKNNTTKLKNNTTKLKNNIHIIYKSTITLIGIIIIFLLYKVYKKDDHQKQKNDISNKEIYNYDQAKEEGGNWQGYLDEQNHSLKTRKECCLY